MKNYCSDKILEKFRAALKTALKAYQRGQLQDIYISMKNRKMGPVPSFSMLPFVTCPWKCLQTCGKYCYAARDANRFPDNLARLAENTALMFSDMNAAFEQIENACKGFRFFRWHVAGDIINIDYFAHVVSVAKACPCCDFLMFTKRFSIVNGHIAGFGPLPENLHVIFSGEKNIRPENPYNLPESYVIKKGETVPDNMFLCNGNCFQCGCRGLGCWRLQTGERLALIEH